MILPLLFACAVPMILPNHDPELLLTSPIPSVATPSFAGMTLVLELDADRSLAPTGAMLDDLHHAITPVQQSYLVSQPGWVLFEALADSLAASGATVYRRYGHNNAPAPRAAVTVVGMTVDAFEFHVWRTEHSRHHLLRARIDWRVPGQSGSDTIVARVAEGDDVFAAAGAALAAALRPRIP